MNSSLPRSSDAENLPKLTPALLERAARLGHFGAWALEHSRMRVIWSRESLAIFGFAPDRQPCAREGLARLERPSRRVLANALSACVANGTPLELECAARRVDREPLWVRIFAEAERAPDGTIVRAIGAIQDVSDSKSADRRLRELNSRVLTTLESMTDAFFTMDRDWRLTYVNAEAERLLGTPRTELLGKVAWHEFQEAQETFRVEYERALATSSTVRFEKHFEGVGRWFQVTAYPSKQGLAVSFRDVTEARAMRAALEAGEERHRRLFETSVDGIFMTRPDGSVVAANAATCAMFGYTEAQICSLGRGGLIAGDDARLSRLLEQRQRTGTAAGQLTCVRADGSRFEALVTSAVSTDSTGQTVSHVIVRDLSERIAYENEILALNEQLGERVKQRTAELEAANADLRAFAHSLAHDLRSPIAAIDGFAAALQCSPALAQSDQDLHYLSRIRAASSRMEEYLQALLSLARVAQGELECADVSLTAVAESILADLRHREPYRPIVTHVEPGLTARGDPTLLRMVLENLLGNAWKFSSHRSPADIRVGSSEEGGNLVFWIQDNGAGFDMAYSQKLFAPFQRLHTDAEFPGTGIGLANVNRIVARHGGRVWARGEVDGGATFYFSLPRRTPAKG